MKNLYLFNVGQVVPLTLKQNTKDFLNIVSLYRTTQRTGIQRYGINTLRLPPSKLVYPTLQQGKDLHLFPIEP